MKSFLLIFMLVFVVSFKGNTSTCVTNEGSKYECGNVANMLEVIMSDMDLAQNTAYIYNGSDKVLRHIVRYSYQGNLTDSYFQDYIFNVSSGFFHLVHFVKNSDSQYDVYLETDIQPSGSFDNDTNFVSRRVNYLGTTTHVSFDENGYPSTTLKTATDIRKLTSSKTGLSFSIVGSFSEVYHLVYKLK